MEESVEFKCDFCNSNKYRVRKDIKSKLGISVKKYEIAECLKCHLISLFPHPTQQELLTFYKNYSSRKNRYKDEYIREKSVYPDKLKKLKQYANGSRLLDIGAGLGTFTFMAKREGFDVTGIELSEEQCRKAKDKYDVDLLCRNIFEIKKNIGKFDVIHLHHVMEHLTSPAEMFDIFGEIMNDGGILLIEVPYQLKRIQDSFVKIKKNKVSFNIDHLFFFTPQTMKNYISTKGFSIIEFSQHRTEKHKGNIITLPMYFFRYTFHKLTTYLRVPSGSFVEYYCRKND